MEIKIKQQKIEFNPIRLVLLIICIYIFVSTSPYWVDKFQTLLANDKNIDWCTKEVLEKGTWGETLSPNHDLLVVPYGETEFTAYYSTELYSLSGFWGAIPYVSILNDKDLKYTVATVEPAHTDVYPGTANRIQKMYPYLKFSIDSGKENLHKTVEVKTNLELDYPQKTPMSLDYDFEYVNSEITRDFKLYFVSPDEYLAIKNILPKDKSEMKVTPFIRGFISILFLIFIVLNGKSLFKKSNYE